MARRRLQAHLTSTSWDSATLAVGPLFNKGSRDPARENASWGKNLRFFHEGPSGLAAGEGLLRQRAASRSASLCVNIPVGGNPPKRQQDFAQRSGLLWSQSQRFLSIWRLDLSNFQSTTAPVSSISFSYINWLWSLSALIQSRPVNERVGGNTLKGDQRWLSQEATGRQDG